MLSKPALNPTKRHAIKRRRPPKRLTRAAGKKIVAQIMASPVNNYLTANEREQMRLRLQSMAEDLPE